MNQGHAENDFLVGLKNLLEAFRRSLEPSAAAAFGGAEPLAPLEHTIRIHLHDKLLELLGWRLGLGGDVAEEARIKDETTTFIDYLGVNPNTQAPALLWESKAWDKPFITAGRKSVTLEVPRDLLVRAIRHALGGSPVGAPAGAAWYDYLDQVAGYVRTLKVNYGHELPCAAISSGAWLVIFKEPVKTLILGDVSPEDLEIFQIDQFLDNGRRIHRLLSRETLGPTVPYPLRPGQLGHYAGADDIEATFRSLHLHYEERGTRYFSTKPRVTVYPAVTLVRRDGAFLTAFEDQGLALEYPGAAGDAPPTLTEHIDAVQVVADALLAKCSAAIGKTLVPAPLEAFPGFVDYNSPPLGAGRRNFVQGEVRPDLWLLVTGEASHFLRPVPALADCLFHTWKLCQQAGQAIGDAAVGIRRTAKPRSFFIDEEPHHCAHQGLNDHRNKRCQIAKIDQRVCCQACVYADVCWDAAERDQLPCGD